MKVPSGTRSIWRGVLSLLALSTSSLLAVEACERECQLGVSHAFADKYQVLTSHTFANLSSQIRTTFFYGVPTTAYSPAEATDAITRLQEAVTRAQQSWDVPLFRTILDTIFLDEPKFQGDCNDPHRVDQPPVGVNWTMKDCHAMDYICGKPPSICHFLPMIKARIDRKLTGQLRTKVGGGGEEEAGGRSADDGDVYANFLGPALSRVLTAYPRLEAYRAVLHGNLNQVLENVTGGIVVSSLSSLPLLSKDEKVEEEEVVETGRQWTPQWDLEIKSLLLSFP
ncbi:hypothetical protein BGX23_000979 [Mortierella sp. AD031]|nr:hypothetical protein BGX23_000979 [Mortierella sp. AD031]KAG0213632.1 hypothetical protein BGX33_002785 [Mortierella sp. NVP41]